VRYDILFPISIATLASCRSVPITSLAVIPKGVERRAVAVHETRATEHAERFHAIRADVWA